ncbi:hypothetical protein Pla163_08320 [Planctomycetes bacterium Pla163]|uniref:Uncharacterized protein n=1 Tax=Rohdeia mirabilis TaxID=2528008 RepID=A0A518CWX5_9BACT|nr:hypothetical protein Pla163_08320 [Planctomycetes bacterium Pla163]
MNAAVSGAAVVVLAAVWAFVVARACGASQVSARPTAVELGRRAFERLRVWRPCRARLGGTSAFALLLGVVALRDHFDAAITAGVGRDLAPWFARFEGGWHGALREALPHWVVVGAAFGSGALPLALALGTAVGLRCRSSEGARCAAVDDAAGGGVDRSGSSTLDGTVTEAADRAEAATSNDATTGAADRSERSTMDVAANEASDRADAATVAGAANGNARAPAEARSGAKHLGARTDAPNAPPRADLAGTSWVVWCAAAVVLPAAALVPLSEPAASGLVHVAPVADSLWSRAPFALFDADRDALVSLPLAALGAAALGARRARATHLARLFTGAALVLAICAVVAGESWFATLPLTALAGWLAHRTV